MGDTKRISQGKQRAPEPAPSPAAANALGARGGRPNTDAAGRRPAFRWPDPDEPGSAAAEGVSDTELFALRRGNPEPEERIDLHGTRRDAAGRLVAQRLESARARGLRSVLIVHGHGKRSEIGETVLKQALPKWLTQGASAKSVLAFTPAPKNMGGEGATIVLLRRDRGLR
ncbi:MAG: Smr/MutS family protein [Myxococcota bacterium]